MIDSICVSWNPMEEHYLITVLDGVLKILHAEDMQEVIHILEVIDEEHESG